MLRKALTTLSVLIVMAACGSNPVALSPAQDANRKTPSELKADSTKSGGDLYHSADCALCHGKNGDGKGFLAKDAMPSYETRNTPDQIRLMVAYIRSLSMN